ncbi:MAG: hypothetical protein ACR2MB_09400 [Acidimicrobiales bacterium]
MPTKGQVRGAPRKGEVRAPAALAVVVTGALYVGLPNHLFVGPRFAIPALEMLLLVPLIAVNPTRMTRETRWSRVASLCLVLIVVVANLVTLELLVRAMVVDKSKDGQSLLLGAVEIWVTNVLAFALAYWELDRGGPVSRTQVEPREELPPADFRFSQDENDDAVYEVAVGSSGKADWVPTFPDYLYVSITNSTAFSPTDTMPLTHRAKGLMATQCIAALVVSLLVIARAVSVIQ